VLDECDEVDAGTLRASFRRPLPAFSLQNLRYALAAADYGSFRRAAEALLLRQSTLSRCVRQLEESIGTAVFERSSGGVRATQAGRRFLRSARSILEQVEALAARTQSTGRGEAGRLTVGFYTSLAAGNLRATLIDVSQRFPQLELEMFESSRARLITALRSGVVDIAINLDVQLQLAPVRPPPADELPDVFLRVELGAFGRQREAPVAATSLRRRPLRAPRLSIRR
jgi:DNA-binding transcriptional LysR family regulator